MGARYLLRFDDICPTMNWTVWDRVEPMLVRHDIRPILAVVPDNQDPQLMIQPPRSDFWDRVRSWQASGWCIALHGYQHRYLSRDAGLMGINNYSEFAGLDESVQREKLRRALAIFSEQGVRADAWVAPAHAFDTTTVRLLKELGLDTLSDGFFFRPVRYLDVLWIPQQFWHFRPMPAGLWTVCLHVNAYGELEIARLAHWLETYELAMTTVAAISSDHSHPKANWLDRGFACLVPALRALRRCLR